MQKSSNRVIDSVFSWIVKGNSTWSCLELHPLEDIRPAIPGPRPTALSTKPYHSINAGSKGCMGARGRKMGMYGGNSENAYEVEGSDRHI